MTDYPIIFSKPMIRALLAGRKTMTRRMPWAWLKFIDEQGRARKFSEALWHKSRTDVLDFREVEPGAWKWTSAPVREGGIARPLWIVTGPKPGDRLWTRETLAKVGAPHYCWTYGADGQHISMSRQDPRSSAMISWAHHYDHEKAPSIHQPRWASRFTLTITAPTKIERLQAISYEDTCAEGWGEPDMRISPDMAVHRDAARDWWEDLWIDIHSLPSWRDNPELAALTFSVEQRNIDAVAA